MSEIRGFAKVNLALQVRPRDRSDRHPLRSLVQSIDLDDIVTVAPAEEDGFIVEAPEEVPGDENNLAWRAMEAVRLRVRRPISMRLNKRIPVAAGLGGGSADAAASLVAAGGLFGADEAALRSIAPGLGGDVPFCLTGGRLWMEGYGERLTPTPMSSDFWLAIAVPPFELSTAAVYRRWDALDGPAGPAVDARWLPPSLRELAPLVNDLTPAAIALRPDLGEWIVDLAAAWGTGVAMSGSGPAVFGFFADVEEATDAADEVRGGRAAMPAAPLDRGWEGDPGGTLPPPPWGVV